MTIIPNSYRAAPWLSSYERSTNILAMAAGLRLSRYEGAAYDGLHGLPRACTGGICPRILATVSCLHWHFVQGRKYHDNHCHQWIHGCGQAPRTSAPGKRHGGRRRTESAKGSDGSHGGGWHLPYLDAPCVRWPGDGAHAGDS